MIIPITLPDASGSSKLPPSLAQIGTSELVLIELQGTLEVEGDKRGQTVGTLTMSDDGKTKPTLLVGYHLLEGKVVSLPKPLAVLYRKAPPSVTPPPNDDLESDNPSQPDTAPEPPSYTITAIVRKKLVFSKRPTPIVGALNTGLARLGTASAKPVSSVGRPVSEGKRTR
ncbi:hypothetical protein FA95DRAFT_1356654 [Auriscalpium vulgare]|uniref:Uncharacterized protein n=1 Tax=Auriscalpium vulgare TaxID=40419 RepID=A0ACB8RQX9_9AGAM|nr:hypothetical protein FA95DRAFT_1356654 [Auriscalpium vulgare]